MEGDLSAVASLYVHPLVVYAPDGIRIEKNPQDTIRALAEVLMSARAAGATDIQVDVSTTEPVTGKRQPFDVAWSYVNVEGLEVAKSRRRYFCAQHEGTMRIELIELIETVRGFGSQPYSSRTAVNH